MKILRKYLAPSLRDTDGKSKDAPFQKVATSADQILGNCAWTHNVVTVALASSSTPICLVAYRCCPVTHSEVCPNVGLVLLYRV